MPAAPPEQPDPEPAAVTLVSFSCDLAAVTADVGRGVPLDEAVERNVRETWLVGGKADHAG
jgi:hypothetical protein